MLRHETEILWNKIKEKSALRGFVLAGGTALSMHLNHRLSEDLDFMFIGNKLPLGQIESLKKTSNQDDFHFVSNDSIEDIYEWEDSGLNLMEYQQNYIVGGAVKVTFWAPDPEVLRLMNPAHKSQVRIASLQEIFQTKCLVCADRSKTRDWFDLFTMLHLGSFDPIDIYNAFDKAKVPTKYDIARFRMTNGSPGIDDEGYNSLLENPPSKEIMQEYFRGVFAKIEVEVSKKYLEFKSSQKND